MLLVSCCLGGIIIFFSLFSFQFKIIFMTQCLVWRKAKQMIVKKIYTPSFILIVPYENKTM